MQCRSTDPIRCGQVVFVVGLLVSVVGSSVADPVPPPSPPPGPPPLPFPQVFCFRITDIERVPGDVEADAFIFEFEALNWTATAAGGLSLAATIGTTNVDGFNPTIVGNGIDPDGRGGPVGGSDIGPGVFDALPIQSGRGRGDTGGLLNDWTAVGTTATTASWSGAAGTAIPSQDLLGVANGGGDARSLVPGAITTLDSSTAIDGGIPNISGTYSPDDAPPFAGPPAVDGSGNVLDGFTMTIDDFDVGETISMNWFLLDGAQQPIGVAGQGNAFGFGLINLQRAALGANAGPALFGSPAGNNTGMGQTPTLFYDSVFDVPNPANFVGEFGAGLTAPFSNPDDNQFDAPSNADLIVPVPAAVWMSIPVLCGIVFVRVIRRKS